MLFCLFLTFLVWNFNSIWYFRHFVVGIYVWSLMLLLRLTILHLHNESFAAAVPTGQRYLSSIWDIIGHIAPFTLTHIQIIHSELVEGVQRHSAPRPLTSRVSALLTAVSCLSDCQRRSARTARLDLSCTSQ